MSTDLVKQDQEQINFDKDQIEFIYSVAITSIRLINTEQSPTAQDLTAAWQRVAEMIGAKGDISVSDIGIATQ